MSLHGLRKSRVASALIPPLIAGMLVLTLPTRSQAQTEKVHGIAVMLALKYLAYRAGTGDTDAQRAIDVFGPTGTFTAKLKNSLADPYNLALLGLEPSASYGWRNVNGVDQEYVDGQREEPGLSGRSIPGELNEFPSGSGVILGMLAANVDNYTDLWAEAYAPFTVAANEIDEDFGPTGKSAVDSVGEWIDDTAHSGLGGGITVFPPPRLTHEASIIPRRAG